MGASLNRKRGELSQTAGAGKEIEDWYAGVCLVIELPAKDEHRSLALQDSAFL